ncbi:MAG: hypothetical protein KDC75_15705, partial [Phaeodactylibacter sp.]|nr:hypothetical protein [Phaeodactylibacter sp.]
LLMRLVQLPWFRQGYMPDWLRLLLISLLEPKQELQVREAISSFFREGLDQNIGEDPIAIAIPHTRKIAPLIPGLYKEVEKELEEDSPLREYIFAGFLKYGKLAVRVPGLGNLTKRKFMPMPPGVLLAILLFSFFTVGIFSILMMIDIIGEIFQALRASGRKPSYRKAKDDSDSQLPRPKITADVLLAVALLALFSWGAYLVIFILDEWAARRAMKRKRLKR